MVLDTTAETCRNYAVFISASQNKSNVSTIIFCIHINMLGILIKEHFDNICVSTLASISKL